MFPDEKQLRDLLIKLITFGIVWGGLFSGLFGGLMGYGGVSVVTLCEDSLGFIGSSLLGVFCSSAGVLFGVY